MKESTSEESMKLRNLVCLGLLLTIVLSGTVHAWDKQRKGFVLGLGIGLGSASYKQTLSGLYLNQIESSRESKVAVFSNFEIGYAPTNQFVITYSNVVPWFSFTNAYNNDITMISGVGGPVLTYYFRPEPPSFLIGGGFGIATWNAPFESDFDAWSSIGFSGRVGYEFGHNVNLTFHVLGGKPSKTVYGVKGETSTFSFGLTVNWLGY
jgi:hypothetical protein